MIECHSSTVYDVVLVSRAWKMLLYYYLRHPRLQWVLPLSQASLGHLCAWCSPGKIVERNLWCGRCVSGCIWTRGSSRVSRSRKPLRHPSAGRQIGPPLDPSLMSDREKLKHSLKLIYVFPVHTRTWVIFLLLKALPNQSTFLNTSLPNQYSGFLS